MSETSLPSRTQSLRGVDFDDNVVVLSFSISRKLYKCPGCHEYIPIGSEHVLVRYFEPNGNTFYQHWHSDCTRTIVRELRGIEMVAPGFERHSGRRPHRRNPH